MGEKLHPLQIRSERSEFISDFVVPNSVLAEILTAKLPCRAYLLAVLCDWPPPPRQSERQQYQIEIKRAATGLEAHSIFLRSGIQLERLLAVVEFDVPLSGGVGCVVVMGCGDVVLEI